jgi:hypothetical protein
MLIPPFVIAQGDSSVAKEKGNASFCSAFVFAKNCQRDQAERLYFLVCSIA